MATVDFLPAVSDVVSNLVTSSDQSAIPRVNTLAIRSSVRVYHLPGDATNADRRVMLTILTLCGRSDDDRPTAWQTFVISYALICFPELVEMMKADSSLVDYDLAVIDRATVDASRQAIVAQADETQRGKVFADLPPEFPSVSLIAPTAALVQASEIEGLYAYYAMMVFTIGKPITPENMPALTKNRPSALIRRRNLQKCEFILTGDGRPTNANYSRIQGGWIRSTRPRILIVMHHAQLVASPNKSEMLDTLTVNMEMLRNAGQTFMFHVHELLIACPWCIELPALRSAFYHYAKMVRTIHSQPAWFQPYYKLAYQDTTKDVRRKEIAALIAVGSFYAAQTRKTMAQYRIDKDMFVVIRAFVELAKTKGVILEEVPNQLTTEALAV